MATVDFTLRNKNYSIACDEGEQGRILELVDKLTVRVDTMSKTCGAASDNVILALTALMMEDEISALEKKIDNSKSAQNIRTNEYSKDGENSSESENMITSDEHTRILNNTLADAIDPIATYIENLAKKIKTR